MYKLSPKRLSKEESLKALLGEYYDQLKPKHGLKPESPNKVDEIETLYSAEPLESDTVGPAREAKPTL